MEVGATADVERFMRTPLVLWVKTFGNVGEKDGGVIAEYCELVDGLFLNQIMEEIDPKVTSYTIKKVNGDVCQRIQNLSVLIQHIKTYYQETLQQLIMMPLPNVLQLGRAPFSELSFDEMKKILLLLLGCAVQCGKKEEYIEKIQTLDFGIKAMIASHIQEVTESQDSVLDLHWLDVSDFCPEDLDSLCRSMAVHLQKLVDQRDHNLETIVDLMQERECRPLTELNALPIDSSHAIHDPASQRHMAVELADTKAKTRRLRQELEEKSEQLLDCRQDLESLEAELKRFQQENLVLLADARAMRVYRDELDALREKAMRADKLESEVGRYRDKLHSMEFYRAKVEELKEDNQVLLETKTMLEEQLEGSRARSDKLHQLEKHNLQLQAKIHNMEEVKNADQKRIEELLEDNFVLEIAQKRSIEESLHLGWELEQLSKSSQESEGPVQKSLDAEVTEKACSQMLRLERENQRLLTTLEELRRTSDPSVECRHDTLKQVEEVKEEDACINKTFSLDMIQSNTQDKLKISFPKHMDVPDSTDNKELIEQEMQHVTLWRNVGFMGLDVQINKHLKEKDAMQEKMDSSKVEQPESADYLKQKEKGSLDLLCGILDSYHPKVQRDAGTQEQNSLVQHAQCPVSCHALDAENKQLLTALENASRRLRRLEAELWDLECEKQALRGSLEELRIGDRCLEQLEADSKALKQEALQLERDKGRLEKENRRLRQRVEIQEATLDSNSLSLAGLEKENRALGKELEALKECNARVKELENESRDLLKQAAIDQKTLTALQEDMVSEKLKMQNKDKELEKLTRELEKMGLNEQQLLSDQRAADDSRYKQLESDLESSLKRCVEIKEEKMTVLESRLKETSALNQQLRQELRTVKQNYEAMLQREEEDWLSHGDIGGLRAWQKESQEATRELLRVKDHLIEVERNNATLQAERQALETHLEQLQTQTTGQNAQTLALQQQLASLQESSITLQMQNAQLQVEKSTLTSQSASLMAQNIQLQGQQCSLEGERESAVRDREDLRKVNELLLRDHERLTALHERQAAEYESLISKHRGLKNSHRRLELEHHALEDRHNTLLQQKSQLEELERTLKVEQQQMLQEKDKHRSTAAECQRLRDEKDWLDQSYQQLLKENESLQAEHKNTKCLLNTMKLDQMRLESELSNFKEQYQQLDITSTKLTNQCELLTQLKRNLEEENRHLLQQIQTLMLQIRNLLEHTMESKDLFHVEQRQYIDKLNELRRQKEKLEEKIMDQYKFYESSPTKRRGNWITLKMKKLMKTKSREQEKERGRSHVETHCEGSRGHDNSSCGGSQDSAESASNSMDDSLSPKRSSIAALKKIPVMLNRQKERGKLRTLFHRSLSMNDLLHERDLSGRDCADPSDQPMRAKEGDEEHSSLKHPSSQFISHTFPSHMFTSSVRIRPWGEGKDCHKDGVDSIQGHTDGQSESSGAFSLENEAWSSGSSPTQEPPRSRCSESAAPPKPPRDALALASYSSGRGIWRSSSGRATGSKGVQSQNLRRTESARVTRVTKGSCSHSTSRPGDKSSSASSCLDCFSTPLRRGGHGSRGGNGPCSTLPRSSSVISTSEGSSRRASFHSMISRSATASPRKNNIDESRDKESDQIPSPSAHQSASELEAPGLTERPDGADVRCPEPPFRPLFTIDSVFSNTIFGEPSLKSQVQTSFSLDSSHDHKISGVQVKKQAEPVSLDKQENQKSGEQDFSVNESVTSVYHSLSDLSSTKAENEMN